VGDIVAKLNTSFITPLDREDIYLLTTRCDDIIDEVNGLARRMEISHAGAAAGGCAGRSPGCWPTRWLRWRVLSPVEGAQWGHRAQSAGAPPGAAGDVLYAEALHRLFTEEPNAIEVIKWVSIYEQLEDSIDRCKHLAEAPGERRREAHLTGERHRG